MRPGRRRQSHNRVERYLRRLRRWAPRAGRDDLVREARRHLYEAICRRERAGLSRDAAQRRAIQDFGPAWRIGLAERGWEAPSLMALFGRVIAVPHALSRRLRPARRVFRALSRRRPRPRVF